jgi:predicted Fe-S protein YdhL (DUF1289 family)
MTHDEAMEAAHAKVPESEHVTNGMDDCVSWCPGCNRREALAWELMRGETRKPTDAEVIADLRARLARAEADAERLRAALEKASYAAHDAGDEAASFRSRLAAIAEDAMEALAGRDAGGEVRGG